MRNNTVNEQQTIRSIIRYAHNIVINNKAENYVDVLNKNLKNISYVYDISEEEFAKILTEYFKI
jgi:hypothetical protein